MKLSAITEKIHGLRARHSQDVIEIGRLLSTAKQALPHGDWLPYLEREFAWSRTSAERFIRAYLAFGQGRPKNAQLGHFEPSTICLLAEKKTPEKAVEAVLALAKDGAPVSHATAAKIVKEARAEAKPPEAKPYE